MKKIVGKNWDSGPSWRIRDENKAPDLVELTDLVELKNVHFKTSSVYEWGFGCSMIGLGELASGKEFKEMKFRLKFDGHDFRIEQSGVKVTFVRLLVLCPDGSMWVVL